MLLPFKASEAATIGTELEFQIIHPKTFGLVSRAKDLIHNIKESPYKKWIKPEITQSMIEINSSIHQNPATMLLELMDLKFFLLEKGNDLTIRFCGSGTHPFQKWAMQKIYPIRRYKNLSRQYRYLSKQATVFGQHIHIGCASGEDAIYLTHALTRYAPQLIAMAAASPFYQGIDTGFNSSRSTVFNSFPLSGCMPYLLTWKEFSAYFHKMHHLGIIQTMKDFYWDIRPKPEFGTVEVRVCDTPLTFRKAILIVAYLQVLSHYLLTEKPLVISTDLYHLYNYNRFQASRYGFDGIVIQYDTFESTTIQDDILQTMDIIQPYVKHFNSENFIEELKQLVINKENDTAILRNIMKRTNSLPELVHEQCNLWASIK